MLFLRNGVILDGRPHGDSRRVFDEAVRRDVESGSSSKTRPIDGGSTLSLGNKVNHPPRGIQPNACGALDWTTSTWRFISTCRWCGSAAYRQHAWKRCAVPWPAGRCATRSLAGLQVARRRAPAAGLVRAMRADRRSTNSNTCTTWY